MSLFLVMICLDLNSLFFFLFKQTFSESDQSTYLHGANDKVNFKF